MTENHKSERAKNCIENIKILYESGEKVTNLFDNYSTMHPLLKINQFMENKLNY